MITGITLVYTFFGGIKAVVWMDFVQMIVYIGGAFLAIGVLVGNLPAGFELPSEKLQIINTGFDLSFWEFISQPYTLITAIVGEPYSRWLHTEPITCWYNGYWLRGI